MLKRFIARQIEHCCPRLWIEREMRHRPNHFEPEFWLVPRLCHSQKISIDIGANMGQYAYHMAKYSRHVIAFEPNTDLWPSLRRLLGPEVQLESTALSREVAVVPLRYIRGNSGLGTIEEQNSLAAASPGELVETRFVTTRTLDSFGLTDVALIKIDVEGHEEAVLAGSVETLRRAQPALIVESEDRHNNGAPNRVITFLAALGYDAFYWMNGALHEYDAVKLRDYMTATNLTHGITYINNFIFVHNTQSVTAMRLQQHHDRS